MDDSDDLPRSEADVLPWIMRHSDYQPPDNKQLQAAAPSWFVPPPYGWRHPVAGRHGWLPDPMLLAFGQYVKRGRYLATMSQQRLEDASGVDQGQISRLERALAPAMGIQHVVKLADALGRAFPLGYCPHEHWCLWQPAPKPPAEPPLDNLTPVMRKLLAERDAQELAENLKKELKPEAPDDLV